ncbi:MAG: hypothetical protein FJY35_02855 [Betaproteobacteria bacterium]|nr:hypothetical protein [Betaproteobacteria bacterium]
MAEEKATEVASEQSPTGADSESAPISDALEQAIAQEPIDPELVEELRAAEADFRAAEKAHLETRRQAEQAAEQLQQIIATVLDAAEVANKAASSASLSHKSLSEATLKISKGSARGAKISGALLGASAIFIFGAAGVFAAMSVQLGSKINQADMLMVRMGTQLIEFRDNLAQVRSTNQDMLAMSQRNEELGKTYQQIAARVEQLAATIKAQDEAQTKRAKEDVARFAELAKPRPIPPNPQIEELLKQVRSLDGQIKAQSKALAETSSKLGSVTKEVSGVTKQVSTVNSDIKQLQTVGSNVNNLKRQLEALIALEQQRYRETIQEATRRNQSEAMVAFPKRDASGAPGESTGPRPTVAN